MSLSMDVPTEADTRQFSRSDDVSDAVKRIWGLPHATPATPPVPDFTSMRSKTPPLDAGEVSANLFVKELDPAVDDELFEAIFAKFGQVLSAKVILHIHTAESRGHGFVLFARQEDAVRARGCIDGQRILGKDVVVRFSPQHRTDHLVTRDVTLFARNVPRQTPPTVIDAHFRQYGAVRGVELQKDTARGAKGACVVVKVTFATVDECDKALRAVHGKPNPFAQYALPTDPPPVKLLAKFAEGTEERASRRALERAAAGKPEREAEGAAAFEQSVSSAGSAKVPSPASVTPSAPPLATAAVGSGIGHLAPVMPLSAPMLPAAMALPAPLFHYQHQGAVPTFATSPLAWPTVPSVPQLGIPVPQPFYVHVVNSQPAPVAFGTPAAPIPGVYTPYPYVTGPPQGMPIAAYYSPPAMASPYAPFPSVAGAPLLR